jgi:glycosyltransferase involved in cell wall biosynthesis
MQTISIVISAFNEEKNIERCLKSVIWADEIIVIDNNSYDKTSDIVKKYTRKIFKRQNDLMLNKNKNFGFTKASGDWILYLDADEEIPTELTLEIRNILKHEDTKSGYWIPRKNIIFGKWIEHGLWWPDNQLRLFKRTKGKFPCKHVHEYVKVDGILGKLQNAFIHYNYTSISQFINKFNNIYTENEVQNLVSSGYQFHWSDSIKFPISDFVKIYFAQEGYKDGLHGLVLAILQSFCSFVIFAKVWEKNGFNVYQIPISGFRNEVKRNRNEIYYWMHTSQINNDNSDFHKLWFKFKRKLNIF